MSTETIRAAERRHAASAGAAMVLGLALALFATTSGCTDGPCTRHSDCPTGFECAAVNICILRPDAAPVPDAGEPADAGPDGGEPSDAGDPADAMIDADLDFGEPDAAPDAGP